MQNTETNRIENKEQLNEDFEQEVIAFLNYKEGGIIYVGINKNGQVVGVEDVDYFLENLISAINDGKLGEPMDNDTYYYFKDGKIKGE